jgi:hypothetical protein
LLGLPRGREGCAKVADKDYSPRAIKSFMISFVPA